MYGYYESLILNAINNISNGSYKVVNINDLVVSVGLSKTDFNIVLLAIEYLNENGFIKVKFCDNLELCVASTIKGKNKIEASFKSHIFQKRRKLKGIFTLILCVCFGGLISSLLVILTLYFVGVL